MLDYRKSDLMDELYKRYLQSYELTLETEDITGASAYKFVLECYTRNLKLDIKVLDTEMKYYMQFCKKERKYQVKCENLNFEYIDDVELKEYKLIERLKYRFRRWKYENLVKNFKKTIQKYKLYIPGDWYIEDSSEEIKIDAIEDIKTEESQVENLVQEEKTGDATLLAKNTVAEATQNDEILEEGEQLQITLEEFFSDVEDIDEEDKE